MKKEKSTFEKTRLQAQEIADVCAEINDCIDALKLIKTKQQVLNIDLFVGGVTKKGDECYQLCIDRNIAEKIITENLIVLEKKNQALIKKGIN